MQSLKGMSVVVTGAGGAIGSEIVASLARRQARKQSPANCQNLKEQLESRA